MSGAGTAIDHYLAEFSAQAGRLPGADLEWLRETRERALGRFSDLGFPTPRQEAWKYTRVTPIERRAFRVPSATHATPAREQIADRLFPRHESARLVFVDGCYSAALSMHEPGRGLEVSRLGDALESSPELVRAHLGRHAGADAHAFTALNTAFMSDGAVIHVMEDARFEGAVHLVFVASADAEDVVAHPRILVVAERGSSVSVVESYLGLGDACYFTNALTEVALEAHAEVRHYKIQEEGPKAFHVASLEAHQAPGSRFVSHSISLGGQLVRNDINVTLDGEDAHCTLNGLFMADGRQHVDFHTVIDHVKPRGTSSETYKGILSGRSRGVFDGRIKVHPDAQKSDAHQSSKNLLLSPDAEVDTKPQLEIYADDVKCSHGATVGQLDPDMLFYLRSRGIDAATARALLVFGFARDVLDAMDIEPLRKRLADTLLGRLPNADELRETVQ